MQFTEDDVKVLVGGFAKSKMYAPADEAAIVKNVGSWLAMQHQPRIAKTRIKLILRKLEELGFVQKLDKGRWELIIPVFKIVSGNSKP